MPELNPFRLIQDDDGHWYIIPWDKADEFNKLIEEEEYVEDLDWVHRIDGPHRLKLYGWEED